MTEHALPAGYRFAAVASGIKKPGRLDLGLIVSETAANCAAVFTRNKVIAAPLQLTRPRVASGRCQAILVNSGNANACTGADGKKIAEETAMLTAKQLDLDVDLIALASTGVIGVPLPLAPFQQGIPQLVAALGNDYVRVATAMMTTDAFSKIASAREQDGQQYAVLGLAKGAGMIHPDMATMLCFVLTDAQIDSVFLQELLSQAVAQSFNAITVDGDTSTNDTVLLLANGASGGRVEPGTKAAEIFAEHLNQVLLDLAKMIVRDGEGATKLVRILVTGALTDEQARVAARSIATSSLVKTAFFGQDANWGRIIAAAGYAGVALEQEQIDISFDDITIVKNGISTGAQDEVRASEVLKKDSFTVTLDLHQGEGIANYYTSDLNYDYVRINADYRS